MFPKPILILLTLTGLAAAADPVGLWLFDDPVQPGKATLGSDIAIVGTAPSHATSDSDSQASPVTLDGVITTAQGTANRLVATHGIGANGGGTKANRYTMVFDVMVPGSGQWRTFYQTSIANNNDAEYFLRNSDNAAGRATIGYSAQALQTNRWYRLTVTADLAAGGFFRTYLDGSLFHTHTKPAADGDFALDPSQVVLFGDNDSENHPLKIGMVAIYDRALDASEVAALGGAGIDVISDPGNAAPEVVVQAAGPDATTTSTPETFSFTATDADGDTVQIQADWGDGTLSPWSGFAASGMPVILSHAWTSPGIRQVKARARDANGGVSGWADIQTVTVTGPPMVTFSTPPYLQNMSTTGMVVMAEVVENVPLVLHYGAGFASSVPFEAVASGGGTWFIRAVLDGLTPDTYYDYRISSSDGYLVREGTGFRTAPTGWQDFRFGVIGDVQTTNGGAWQADAWEPAKTMLAHMADRGVRFGLGAGDQAQDGNSYSSTKNSYLDRMAAVLGTRVPYYISWGNHDGNSPTHPLRLASDMPSRHRTDSLSTHTSGFGSFSFEHSGVFFVCIEHFSAFTGTHTYSNSAGNDITNGWLDAQLSSPAAKNARFRVLSIHVPPFSERWIDGNAGLRAILVPRLEFHGVDLCFSGHMHAYQRGHLNGVNYVIAGGGSYLDHNEPLTTDWPHMTVGGYHDVPGNYARQSSNGVLGPPQPIVGGLFHHYVELNVRDRYLRLDTHGFNADGSYIGILDSMELGSDPGPDGDGDGLRDAWELANGLDPDDPSDAHADPDGDGQDNLSEQLAGTAANDGSSVFRVSAQAVTAEGWQVAWSSVPGKRYRLLVSTDLAEWVPHESGGQPVTVEASAGATTDFVLPTPGGRGFVKVEVVR